MNADKDMVRRVARALCDLDVSPLPGFGEGQMKVDYINAHWHLYIPQARVAIAAMRKPTSRMLRAACAAMSPGKRPTQKRISNKAKHGQRYIAMIDAALEHTAPLPPERP
jgi:hypothetical protein